MGVFVRNKIKRTRRYSETGIIIIMKVSLKRKQETVTDRETCFPKSIFSPPVILQTVMVEKDKSFEDMGGDVLKECMFDAPEGNKRYFQRR
jgi:hypothetical protein